MLGRLQLRDRSLKEFQCRRRKAVAGLGPFDSALNEAGGLEFLEVLAHRGLRQARDFDEFSAHAGLLGRNGLDDCEAGRVANGFEKVGECEVLAGKGIGVAAAHNIVLLLYCNITIN